MLQSWTGKGENTLLVFQRRRAALANSEGCCFIQVLLDHWRSRVGAFREEKMLGSPSPAVPALGMGLTEASPCFFIG